MMRRVGIIATFISAMLFPWPLTAFLACILAFVEPLIPLAVGVFVDTLYYSPQGAFLPLFTLFGLGATIVSFFVRSRLKSDPLGDL